ncbi:putative RIMS-binding protein 2 isoform X5 [Apostichopus japonicus]|uniref:Putative RIMS-binding protein 2 isoform X5 n=1 Tax=Stichopus japonicus TaxID=307972 RepID=A0A2G8KNN5_STIJA|nr:putative RIMS-binding protein 2 isoform X5 [Apostichopus japonicus]
MENIFSGPSQINCEYLAIARPNSNTVVKQKKLRTFLQFIGKRSMQEHNSPERMAYQSQPEDDWKKVAEEAKTARLEQLVPRLKREDHSSLSSSLQSHKSSSIARKQPENGEPDSGSEPEELLEDVSDKIDEVLLSRLQPSSLSSAGSAISKLAVYVAKYNYDPYVDSPNDNPDSELPLKAGDYIYVYGDPDEVGHLIRPCGP